MRSILLFCAVLFAAHTMYGQTTEQVDSLLRASFPRSDTLVTTNGVWVYYPDSLNTIRQLNLPTLRKFTPDYSFYEVPLTNYLGHHVNTAPCAIAVNSKLSRLMMMPPMWYSGIDSAFLRLFLGKQLSDSTEAIAFTKECQSLILIDSRNATCSTPLLHSDKIIFDFSEFGRIRRHMEIHLSSMKIVKFVAINPVTHEREEIY